jgi:methyl-accepting chemotaxis protein
MNAIIERFFPDSLRAAEPEVQRRARLALQICLIGVLLYIVYGPILLSYPNYIGAAAGALGSVMLMVSAFLFRSTGSLTLVGHMLSATTLIVFGTNALTSGGLLSQATPWLAFAPLFAVLLMGRKQSRFWLGALLTFYGMLILLDANEMTLPNTIPASRVETAWAGSMIAFAISLYTVIVVFEGGKKQLMELLLEEKASTERKVEEARAELKHEQEAKQLRDQRMMNESQEQQEYLQSSVAHILHGVEQVSRGNLVVHIDAGTITQGARQHDEIQRLAEGLNRAVLGIRQLLQKVHQVTDTTATVSIEILDGTEKMSSTSSLQAHKATEAAHRIAELIEQMQRGATSAHTSAEFAHDTVKLSQEGSNRIQEAITGMSSIAFVVAQSAETIRTLGESSNQIGEIVEVINEIADQTNLLALNAAIEAARAGDQGRGFAVVADEVRKLAERTTKATKEIASMIHRIQHDTHQAVTTIERGTGEVERGTGVVEEAGKSFRLTMENAQRGAGAFSEIAKGIENRAIAFVGISNDVQSVIESMEHGVEMTRTIKHSVESLTGLVNELQQLLRQFTIEDTSSFARAPERNTERTSDRAPERLAKPSPRLALR